MFVALAAALGCVVLVLASDDEGDERGPTLLDASPAIRPPVPGRGPRLSLRAHRPERELLTANVPAPSPERAARLRHLEALWKRALSLHALERHAQALALLENVLATERTFFAEDGRPVQVAAMRLGAKRVLQVIESGESLDDLVAERRRWGNLRPLDDPEAATALERRLRHAAEQVAQLRDAKERERLMRHLRRFLVPTTESRTSAKRGTLDVDGLLADVRKREAGSEEPTLPLPLDDSEDIEKRRMEQIELLRKRGALTLLDSLHAGLAWLALYQAQDGRFSDAAGAERGKTLYPEDGDAKLALRGGLRGSERYALSTTALALMAFLDFRDQDGQGLFEPTIARAVAWLRAQQNKAGLFDKVGRHYYSDAIALMALAQAASSTGDKGLRESVERGLLALYPHRGARGGYRYSSNQAGDVSVSGWVVQAIEYAELAGAEIPPGMKEDLTGFLRRVWLGKERFLYVVGPHSKWGHPALWPVGMLCGRILWKQVPDAVRASWIKWLLKPDSLGRGHPGLYTLYYGVRMDVWLNAKLTKNWHGWLHGLATKQVRTGPLAGAFPSDAGHMVGRGGSTIATALSLLTMEHALFLR